MQNQVSVLEAYSIPNKFKADIRYFIHLKIKEKLK